MAHLTIIAALDSNNGIGYDSELLCPISEDLKRFKAFTTGHSIIMGRKTFESLPKGPLPNRRHIVLTNNPSYSYPGVEVVHSVDEAIELCGEEEAFVIGGGRIYELFLPFVSKMYLTLIHKAFKANVFFPDFNDSDWKIQEESENKTDPRAGVSYCYRDLVRA